MAPAASLHACLLDLRAIFERELGPRAAQREFADVEHPPGDERAIRAQWAHLWWRLAELRPAAFQLPPRLLGSEPFPYVLSFLYAQRSEPSAVSPLMLSPYEQALVRRARRQLRSRAGLGQLLQPGRFFLVDESRSLAIHGERAVPCSSPDGIAGLSLSPEPRLRRTVWFEQGVFEGWREVNRSHPAAAILHEELHAAFFRSQPQRQVLKAFVAHDWEEVVINLAQQVAIGTALDEELTCAEAPSLFAGYVWQTPITRTLALLPGATPLEHALKELVAACLEIAPCSRPADAVRRLNRRFGGKRNEQQWRTLLSPQPAAD